MYHRITEMKYCITILIFLSLISFDSIGQTGYGYFDTVAWSKIDTIKFDSHISLISLEKDSIQEIRVDNIGNSSSTIAFKTISNLLTTVVVVTHVPGRNPELCTSQYEFSNGKLMSWKQVFLFEYERTDTPSIDFINEEKRILELFNHYIKMVEENVTDDK